MTLREGIAVLAAGAGILCAVVFYRQAGDARRETERTTERLNARIADLERRLREAESRPTVQAPPPEPDRKEIVPEEPAEEKTAKPPAPKETPAAAPVDEEKTSSMAAMAKMRRAMEKSPVMKEAMRKGVKNYILEQYTDLFKEWGLEGEAMEKAVETLVDRQLAQQEAGLLLMDPDLSDEEVVAKLAEAQRRAEQIVGNHFAPQQVAALGEFEKTIPGRMATKDAQRQVGDLGIDPTRTAAVVDILVDEERKERERMAQAHASTAYTAQPDMDQIRRLRASMSGAGETPVEAMLAARQESNVRILDRVQPYMTPEQYEKFRAQRQADLELMEMHVKMMRAAQPPESGDNR